MKEYHSVQAGPLHGKLTWLGAKDKGRECLSQVEAKESSSKAMTHERKQI